MDLSRFYNQFREETTENIRIFSDGMLALEKASSLDDPGARDYVDTAFRSMHTIKGSSRLLGFGAIGRLAHTMENILGAVRAGTHFFNRTLIDDLLKSSDALLEMTIAAVEGGSTTANVDELIDRLNQSLDGAVKGADTSADTASAPAAGTDKPAGDESAESAESKEDKEAAALKARIAARKARVKAQREGKTDGTTTEPADSAEPAEPAEPAKPAKPAPQAPPAQPQPAQVAPQASVFQQMSARNRSSRYQTIRVRVDRLDNLINLTGELVVGQQMLLDHVQILHEMDELLQQQERELLALDNHTHSMRLSQQQERVLEQHINSLLNTGDQLRRTFRSQLEQFGRHVDHQGMLTNDLEQEVMAARMLPISTVFATLPRAVRELTSATQKEVNLSLKGEGTELDRKLLEALNDPLLHIIRNAIDHGIEPPDEREAQGKPREGQVTVNAEATGGEVHVTISDDGRGMAPEKLRDSAVQKGLISKENADLLSGQEALELIFLPGFSSAQMITDISGRGVGMDIVRTNINELGGQVMVQSTPGAGTSITLVLPLTIVTTRILLIGVGTHTFAVPATGCHGIIWVHHDQIRTLEGRETIAYEGQTVPLLHMTDLLHVDTTSSFINGKREPAILINSGQRFLSLLVDRLVDEREAVVKPLGPLFENQRRYSGAVQLGDGSLVLLLNPVSLVQSARGIAQTRSAAPGTSSSTRRLHLLVVEDSFTTRELIRSILQSAGYDVTTAVDGHDALDKLRVQTYDLVVTDVEMPRVDGFELTLRVREELGDQETPVVIITSLASDEYRQRGLEAGAQGYIVKSQFNQDNLLEVIQQLLGT